MQLHGRLRQAIANSTENEILVRSYTLVSQKFASLY